MHAYSQNRRGDHYELVYRSLEEFLREFVGNRIAIHGTDLAARERMKSLVGARGPLELSEAVAMSEEFERDRRDALERFFGTKRFAVLRAVGGFNVGADGPEPEA